MPDVNNRENCRVAEVGGGKGGEGGCIREFFVLSIQFSVNLKLLQKQFYWFFFNDMFCYKKKSTFKVISDIPQRSLVVPTPQVFCHLSGHMPSP